MEKRVKKVLNEISEEICKYQGERLLEDRVIDSFDVMEIIAALEEEFGFEIDANCVIIENFENSKSIVMMMEKILKEKI